MMSQILQETATAPRPALYHPPAANSQVGRWRINGYGASVIIWTVAEWEALSERPTDAQYYPCGIWCALRLD